MHKGSITDFFLFILNSSKSSQSYFKGSPQKGKFQNLATLGFEREANLLLVTQSNKLIFNKKKKKRTEIKIKISMPPLYFLLGSNTDSHVKIFFTYYKLQK